MVKTVNGQPRRNGSLTFLRAELETGLLFASLAEQASDQDKIDRTLENARRAYLSVLRFMGKVALSGAEAAELSEKLRELENRLQMLYCS